MPQIGFHTDAFNSAYWSFSDALKWANRNDVHFIECGAIDGVSWIHGLGYQPHIALWEDPLQVRRQMDDLGVSFSQIDAAFPLSRKEGLSLGVRYVIDTIRWAHLAGCNLIDTTDDRFAPEGLSDDEAMEFMKRAYDEILNVAIPYGTMINIEPHGHYTTKPEFLSRMLEFCESPASESQHGYRQHLHRRSGSGGLLAAVQGPRDARSCQGRQRVTCCGVAR